MEGKGKAIGLMILRGQLGRRWPIQENILITIICHCTGVDQQEFTSG
jgi:hypothetical protein